MNPPELRAQWRNQVVAIYSWPRWWQEKPPRGCFLRLRGGDVRAKNPPLDQRVTGRTFLPVLLTLSPFSFLTVLSLCPLLPSSSFHFLFSLIFVLLFHSLLLGAFPTPSPSPLSSLALFSPFFLPSFLSLLRPPSLPLSLPSCSSSSSCSPQS